LQRCIQAPYEPAVSIPEGHSGLTVRQGAGRKDGTGFEWITQQALFKDPQKHVIQLMTALGEASCSHAPTPWKALAGRALCANSCSATLCNPCATLKLLLASSFWHEL